MLAQKNPKINSTGFVAHLATMNYTDQVKTILPFFFSPGILSFKLSMEVRNPKFFTEVKVV